MDLGRVVVTGAAGRIGTAVRAGLRGSVEQLVLVDRAPLTADHPSEEVRQLDLLDAAAVAEALAGAEAVLHLGGVPDEAPLPDLLQANVLGTHHVLEGARKHGLRRVVLASSNRLTGCYPTAKTVGPADPPRPDGLYGVSKVALEALGRLYADKFGLSVVCLRIGSYEDRPLERRHLATWLSPRDCLGYVRAALTTPGVGFTAAYAVSANTRRHWELPAELGYTPLDDAEAHLATLPEEPPGNGLQGGAFAEPAFTLPYL
ncbi:NAD(P)-dependent oxidoreductase [Kitasatospora sp. MMS16-BH015]|uniref:NAD-dependent epimerase/dehydratase family protein n=1 Tax=Kitasatospora sp. MMS16-BH015 TaxID=2018025 RepID=UPI0015811487|nr:NAD(P)-dependent oxidoreductase [Kitasatospora sp. MMS16-BH015]